MEAAAPKCGAKTRAGGVCAKPPVPGRTRCRMHGGNSPAGPAAANWRDGKRSKYVDALPRHYREAYLRAVNSQDLTRLTDQLALMEARETELLKRLSPESSTALWHRAQKALNDISKAMELPAGEERDVALRLAQEALVSSVRQGVATEETWRQLVEVLETRRRLADTERRRVESLKSYMTIEQAVTLAGAMVGIVKAHVTDRMALSEIVRGIQQLLPSGREDAVEAEVVE